ncbi:hypothetical protein [Terrabacter sp. MAHUQ-38]|jgi:hypothetical protein|uniref:hypothetical protein n=1 Tax=unclassified Terrabacter TaxID=2630222 RepID=UPI00165D4DFA|nr:hypothetical protein [Terrabacter sp. MAHUQ-38]MBC9820559.1 hypothetical protein [Terrabacter sp. MAHUQ-38]
MDSWGDLDDREERDMHVPVEPRSRVNYFHGRLVTADDLRREQEQFRARQWLHNRMLHGYGVATGLEVTVLDDELHVSPGLAIDGLGREIVLTDLHTVDGSGVVTESHGRVQLVVTWAEEPVDEVLGPDGPEPSRFVENPRLFLTEHHVGEPPVDAVLLARIHRRGHELVVDASVRRHVYQHVHHDG